MFACTFFTRFAPQESPFPSHASRFAVHESPIAAHQSRISNRYPIIRYRANSLTTNEKIFSNRYFFAHFGAAPHQSRPTNRTISIQYKWNSQNRRYDENKGEPACYSIQICLSWHRLARRGGQSCCLSALLRARKIPGVAGAGLH